MSKERTDEFLKWRGLLDQPDAGLGQVLDEREATWQKLADRLGDRRRNRLSGYRIAAAVLLFALIIPAFRMLQDRRHATGVRVFVHHPDLLPSDRGRSAGPGDGPAAATAVREQHAASSLPTSRSAPPATGGSGSSHQADAEAFPAERSHSSNQANAAALPTDGSRFPRQEKGTEWRARAAKSPARKMDRVPLAALVSIGSPPASIVAAPTGPASQNCFPPSSPAKQMKVVHQNEIHGGNTSSPAVGVTGSRRLLNALFSPDPPPSSSVPSPQEDPALLKIKLSPSN